MIAGEEPVLYSRPTLIQYSHPSAAYLRTDGPGPTNPGYALTDCADSIIYDLYRHGDEDEVISSRTTNDASRQHQKRRARFCSSRVSPSKPEDHYRAVCRALATETLELRTFLQRVCTGEGAEVLRLKAQAETSGKELEKIHFSDWMDLSAQSTLMTVRVSD
ncbi:spire [Culex quinquefasciatus]|uniref:Spire n=1 Tax=Culex quinquefasciatus TaxID=7176 RepID=B0WVB9_CULQU|nr:spire [Culex quinquefasciatus]|eukprot:XP_001861341.1 spire [Culex quinquefasciatus]